MKKVFAFLRLLKPYRRFLSRSIAVALVLNLLELPVPYLTKELIDNVFPNRDANLLVGIVFAIFFFTLFNIVVGVVNSYYVGYGGAQISLDLKYDLLRRLLRQSFKYYDNTDIGDILSRFQDADQAIGSTVAILSSFVMNTLSLLIFPAVLLLINWKLTLLSILILPFDILLTFYTNRWIKRLQERMVVANAENIAQKVEVLQGIRVIQSLNLQEFSFGKICQSFENIRGLGLGSHLVSAGSNLVSGMLSAFGTMLFTYIGWTAILGNQLSLGTFLAFSMYIGHLYGPLKSMIGISQQLQVAVVHSSRFFEIYDRIPEITDCKHAIPMPRAQGEIAFEDVSFNYEANVPVLRNISCRINPGDTIALVSRSGGGKSSFLGLIPRYYDVTSGRITIDGIDIRQMKLYDLRSNVGFVWQEPEIFSGTILQNITLGKNDASAAEVEEAARWANAHDFIMRLPDRYQTLLGDNGVGLSVGERQRICLARVLLLDAPIILFDEITAALDAESEEVITNVIKSLKGKKTMVMIAHRLATIQHADRIIVLDGGRIVETGCHAELIAKRDGIYRMLYMKQHASVLENNVRHIHSMEGAA